VGTIHVSARAVAQTTATYASECQWKLTPPGGSAITFVPGSGNGYTYFDVANASITVPVDLLRLRLDA